MNKAFVQIQLQIDSRAIFKIYWVGENQRFSEKRSHGIRVNPGKKSYGFYLTDLKYTKMLRIDPADRHSKIVIKSISIKQLGYDPIRFENPDEFKRLIPVHDIQRVEICQDGLTIISTGIDPQLQVSISPKKKYIVCAIEIAKLFAIISFITFFVGNITKNIHSFNYTPYLMVIVIILVFLMAAISQYNSHPDESVHIRAADYYQDHWLPPEICSPEIEHTYSRYGYSRLDTYEIIYFFAGKFSRLLSFLPIGEIFRLRLFNVFLFSVLLILTVKNVEYRLIAIPLLISPQIWYVFSYFNNDSMSLFFLFLVSYQVLIKKSLMNTYLEGTRIQRVIIHGIMLGILFSMLLLVKKNYYIFIVFLFSYYLFKFYSCKLIKLKSIFVMMSSFSLVNLQSVFWRMCFIIFVAGIVFGLRYSVDIYVNGFDRSKKMLECTEKMAGPDFKPSTNIYEKYYGLALREKGFSLKQTFSRYNWGVKSFFSSFGVYGYTSIFSSLLYYELIKIIGIFFIIFLIYTTLTEMGFKGSILLFIVFACSFLLIGLSLWHSWTADFQAQGRYLLPIAAMFSFLFFHSKNRLDNEIFHTFVMIMFFISLYSFIFTGLIQIPKNYSLYLAQSIF